MEGSSSEPPRQRQRQSGPRRYIPRPREKGHDDLVANYLSANPIYTDEMFRRRFRMNKSLFLRIVDALSAWDVFFLPNELMQWVEIATHLFKNAPRLFEC